MLRNKPFILGFIFVLCAFSSVVSGQKVLPFGGQNDDFSDGDSKLLTRAVSARAENQDSGETSVSATFPVISEYSNPLIFKQSNGCQRENLDPARFDRELDAETRISFCEAVQDVSNKLKQKWSPDLSDEIGQIWQVFTSQKVVIRPMKKGVSSNVIAAAEAFTNNETGAGFNASFYLRAGRVRDKSFLLVFMHEMRHAADFYSLWKNHTSITEAELEMRGFRIMGRIYAELRDKPYFFRMPTFWDDDWKNLPPSEIERRREEKIEKFMRGNGFYKSLMKNADQHTVGYLKTEVDKPVSPEEKASNAEKLPARLKLVQTKAELAQNVKQLTFTPEKAADAKNTDEILRAALANEKNLYFKMDNFVYDQNLQLQCWKKEQVTENYTLNSEIARTSDGEKLLKDDVKTAQAAKMPKCVMNPDLIKSDADDTFWAAPYLDQMTVKFDSYADIAGIKTARYTVYQPTAEQFKNIAAKYPRIKNFRAFVGTIYVAINDAQIIKFWGTSFSQAAATGYEAKNTFGSYSATAIRQKLASGIWVTSTLNTVAVTSEKDKMKPFSYIVKYENYRQAATEVKILDDETAVK